ncbi:MAG TPA: TonB-dependent receptor [Polyangiaceae bacterium]|nr:TonB-dependent receptor [Polyangiaceae bacterium]
MRLPGIALSLCLAVVCLAGRARADDLADEADLEFRLAAERYTASDYRGALEHFLASNRLAPNRNVVFNIARTYEKLQRFPEAFRYYTTALADETDPAARARISTALDAIRPHVAVLDVTTAPSGATLYIDRKDLGSRGESPRVLGVLPGKYRLIAELPGYYPGEAVIDGAAAGVSTNVGIVLRQILGRLRVEGLAHGARVRVDDETALPRCVIPCTLDLPPGPHQLHVSLEGHKSAEVNVDVVAQGDIVVRPRLDEVTGALVVTTDEPGALVQIDDHVKGFTPAILTLPVGVHQVRIALRGFATVERQVTIAADHQGRIDETLTRREQVQAASRRTESVEDAPTSVTVISREELLAFGYPTIVEAVRGVRGMYVSNDHSYESIGVRGLGGLGGYGNRILVLIDGQPTNDDWLGSAYVGYDGRVDLADIDRIEVVRGPGSVLYGTNAVSGVINLVTRSRGERPGAEVGVSAVGSNVGRGRYRAQAQFGEDGGIWASISGAHGSGEDLHFPSLAGQAGATPAGDSRGADYFNAGTVQGRVWWRWLTAQWFFTSHDKALPTGEFQTLLGNSETHQSDRRGFIEARAEPTLSKEVKLETRLHWNTYQFRGTYARLVGDGGIEHDRFDGAWVGAEQRILYTPSDKLRITLGAEGQDHYKVATTAQDDNGYFLADTQNGGRKYQVGALYALADAEPARRIRLSGGVRLDGYSTFGTSVNPRASIILRPYERGNLKIVWGKAFRAPSIYELDYNDGGTTQIASPNLNPESIYSFEIEHSHRFTPTVTGTAAVYTNYVRNLIQSAGAGTEEDPLHYVNSPVPEVSLGVEVGIRREWRQGFMLEAWYAYQHSAYLASESLGDLAGLRKDPTTRNVANSPEHLASVKAAAPLIARGITMATRITFEGPRYDRFESVNDPAQGKTPPVVLWDLVISGEQDRFGLRYSVGAYNITDYRYSLPVSNEFTQVTIPQRGRTFLVSIDKSF